MHSKDIYPVCHLACDQVDDDANVTNLRNIDTPWIVGQHYQVGMLARG